MKQAAREAMLWKYLRMEIFAKTIGIKAPGAVSIVQLAPLESSKLGNLAVTQLGKSHIN